MLESDQFREELLDIFGTEMLQERSKVDQILAKNPILKNA
jgi:hypothetical protein